MAACPTRCLTGARASTQALEPALRGRCPLPAALSPPTARRHAAQGVRPRGVGGGGNAEAVADRACLPAGSGSTGQPSAAASVWLQSPGGGALDRRAVLAGLAAFGALLQGSGATANAAVNIATLMKGKEGERDVLKTARCALPMDAHTQKVPWARSHDAAPTTQRLPCRGLQGVTAPPTRLPRP